MVQCEGPARRFDDLTVWNKAHQFVLGTYRITRAFPDDERFGLTSQFRRAAVSVPANIAEGFRRRGVQDKLRFLNIAEASLEECRYYIRLGVDLGYLEQDPELHDSSDEVARLPHTYASKIRNNNKH